MLFLLFNVNWLKVIQFSNALNINCFRKKKKFVLDSKNQCPYIEGKHESKSKASTFSYLIKSALKIPRVALAEIGGRRMLIGNGIDGDGGSPTS